MAANCSDGVVAISDLKITRPYDRELLEYRNKIFGVFGNVVFAPTGDMGMYDFWETYALGEAVKLRDSAERYSDANIIGKLTAIMDKLRTLRGGGDPGISVMVARQFPRSERKPDLHVIRSQGSAEPITTKWKSIGHFEATSFADKIISQNWRDNITMKEFAKIAYSIIRRIEDEKIDPTVGVGEGQPTIRYLATRGEIDVDATPEETKEFQECYLKSRKDKELDS